MSWTYAKRQRRWMTYRGKKSKRLQVPTNDILNYKKRSLKETKFDTKLILETDFSIVEIRGKN